MKEQKGDRSANKGIQKSKTQRSPSPHPAPPTQDATVQYDMGPSPAKSTNNAEKYSDHDQELQPDLAAEKSSDKSKALAKLQEPGNSKTMLACLCLVNLFANSAYSSIAPFYPIEAVKKGVPTSLHGIVFAAYSISMAIFSPLFARMLNSHGPKRMLIMGCICEGVSMIVFGLFDFVEGPTAYAICSFSCRFLEGFGFGCLNSSSSKIVMMIFPEQKLARMNGILQSFTGFGMLVGPILGSFLFKLGGFQLPFYTVGVLLLLLAVANHCIIPQSLDEFAIASAQGSQVCEEQGELLQLTPDKGENLLDSGEPLIADNTHQPNSEGIRQQALEDSQELRVREAQLVGQFTFWKVGSHLNIFTIAMCMSLSLLALTFKEPIFALILNDHNLGVQQIGVIFSIDTITYSLTSMALHFVKDERNGLKYSLIMFAGLLTFTISMLLTGPAPFLPDKSWILCCGCGLSGIGAAFVNNNSVPAMFMTEMEEYSKVSKQELSEDLKQKLQSSVASINTGAFGIGSIIGPILASFMVQFISYRKAFMIIGFFIFVCSTLHFYSQVIYRRKPNPVYKTKLSA